MATLYVPPEWVPSKTYPKLPPRAKIEDAIETLIAILDSADPNTDFEELGAEDSFQPHDEDGPGCPVSDPGKGLDDGDERDMADEGEPEEGVIPPASVYAGVDQSKPDFNLWRRS